MTLEELTSNTVIFYMFFQVSPLRG